MQETLNVADVLSDSIDVIAYVAVSELLLHSTFDSVQHVGVSEEIIIMKWLAVHILFHLFQA